MRARPPSTLHEKADWLVQCPMLRFPASAACLLAVATAACHASARPAPVSRPYVVLPDLPPRPDFDPDADRLQDEPGDARRREEIQLTGPLKSAPAIRSHEESKPVSPAGFVFATHRFLYGAPGQAGAPASPAAMLGLADTADSTPGLKIERAAQLALEVQSLDVGAGSVIALVQAYKGFVGRDERLTSTYPAPSANLLVRVPASDFDAFLAALSKVGEIRGRRVTSVDATLEHKDVEVLVANLQAAQARYREILQRATDPAQVLAVERELERVHTDLDRVQARLEFLRSRVAYATIVIILSLPPAVPPVSDLDYQALMATGVRALALVDLRSGGTNGYAGAGLSLRFPRSTGDSGRGFALDVDVVRACCDAAPLRSNWAYDVLTGLDLYSESLENGKRRWLNPFLGIRMGVAQTQDRLDFAAAGVFGLDIVKTRLVAVNAQARLMAFVGNPDGPHAAVQPSLGVDLGF